MILAKESEDASDAGRNNKKKKKKQDLYHFTSFFTLSNYTAHKHLQKFLQTFNIKIS